MNLQVNGSVKEIEISPALREKSLLNKPINLSPIRIVFKSIQLRIMTATTLLTIVIIGVVTFMWAGNENYLHRQQKEKELQALVFALSDSWVSEIVDRNWGQMRLTIDILMQRNNELAYVLVSDSRLVNQIIAASDQRFVEQYIPEIVPASISQNALVEIKETLFQETFLLEDIEFPKGKRRSRQGEPVIEAAYSIRNSFGERLGTLRIGSSLERVNEAVAKAIFRVLLVGIFCLMLGLGGAYLLAKEISQPIQRLQQSAGIIAAGDLDYRAVVDRSDELGTLAVAFNEMSIALQDSFYKLQKTLTAFQLFVPQKFLSVIASDGVENIKVGVYATRTITILFADIRGYTSMSEQLSAKETFQILNKYLACMGEAIDAHDGFIDKYIGDAIMALFDTEYSDNALKAALAMQRSLQEFNLLQDSQQQPRIQIGIGIHRGEVIMGTVGFTSRIESTVIGDAVNVAARVESLTRNYDCGIIATNAVVTNLLQPENFSLKLIDEAVKVKGKGEAIAIYEIN